MSDSDSDSNEPVEESPFDDYGGPDNSSQNYDDGATNAKNPGGVRSAPPLLGEFPSEDSEDSSSPVGELPKTSSSSSFQLDSVKTQQMSRQFKDLMTDLQEDDEDLRYN